jgi:glycosyltransferase involved in cell wall biosynthesis
VPDFAADAPPRTSGVIDGVDVVVSRWFDRREAFEVAAGGPAFFFAPRPLEGIGMACLEAMARGQIVIAPDLPAANEYVAHLTSGLLYDPVAPPEGTALPMLDDVAVTRMSQAARRKAVEGRRTWLADIDRLKSILADDGRRWSTSDASAAFARTIRAAARARMADGC